MLHELLMALSGCPGSLFTLRGETIALDASLPLFSASERALLDELCQLGTWYRHVRVFSERRRLDSCPGRYVSALCGALREATGAYERSLVQLERQLLEDADLGPAFVFQAVQPHAGLLRALHRLLQDVAPGDAAGCRLLDTLHRHVAGSVGDERGPLRLLLRRCQRVLLAQLASWLLHGLLPDAGDEFFVRQKSGSETDGAALARPAEPEPPPAPAEYELAPDRLPAFLPLRVCESVLFVGSSIQLCRQRDGPVDVVGPQAAELAAELEALAAEPVLAPLRLERLVNRIKTLVARQLWRVVVVDAGLVQHLALMKTFFLLGSGALFQQLFNECDRLLRQPARTALEPDLNEALQVACAGVGLEEEASEGVYLTVVTGGSGWDGLRLRPRLRWPLHLLYTPQVLDTYNEIFSFLLQVKRTQLMLDRLWAEQMRARDAGPANRLRAHMAFLVNNLQYYLHIDVIDSEYSLLQAAISSAEDYEQLRHAHDRFLGAISSQCFLQSAPVSECLRALLAACQQLCAADPAGPQLAELRKALQTKSQLLFRILSGLRDQRAGSHLSRLLLRIDFNHFVSRAL